MAPLPIPSRSALLPSSHAPPHSSAPRPPRPPKVFIADDAELDAARRGFAPLDGLLCGTCQLPECKPECPGSVAPAAAAAVPVPPVPPPADEAALSEGRSSEDSVLLGLPSPKDSVLPAVPPGAGEVQPMCIGLPASPGSSPPVQPCATLARLSSWHEADAQQPPQQQQQREQQHAAPAAAALAAPGPGTASAPSESALAAALRGIGRGLASSNDDAHSSIPPKLPPLPPARTTPARWEVPERAAASRQPAPAPQQPAAAGTASGSSALAAALTSISKGLVEDGLL